MMPPWKKVVKRDLPDVQVTFERLMCEVEFWEVFYRKNEGF